jgi:HEPN domain-containing protein
VEEPSTDDAKQQVVQAWLTKAAHDLGAAGKLAEDGDLFLDVAIYHCQQAAEKAVKAFLIFHDQRIPRNHDVQFLVAVASSLNEEALSTAENFCQFVLSVLPEQIRPFSPEPPPNQDSETESSTNGSEAP